MFKSKNKLIYFVLSIFMLIGVSCSLNDTPQTQSKVDKTQDKEIDISKDNKNQPIELDDATIKEIEAIGDVSNKTIPEIVEYNLPKDMKANEINVDKDVVSIKVEILNNNRALPTEVLATDAFSKLTDKLLEKNELNTFKMEFISVGSIEMHREDSVKQEEYPYLPYFPSTKIEENFKKIN